MESIRCIRSWRNMSFPTTIETPFWRWLRQHILTWLIGVVCGAIGIKLAEYTGLHTALAAALYQTFIIDHPLVTFLLCGVFVAYVGIRVKLHNRNKKLKRQLEVNP